MRADGQPFDTERLTPTGFARARSTEPLTRRSSSFDVLLAQIPCGLPARPLIPSWRPSAPHDLYILGLRGLWRQGAGAGPWTPALPQRRCRRRLRDRDAGSRRRPMAAGALARSRGGRRSRLATLTGERQRRSSTAGFSTYLRATAPQTRISTPSQGTATVFIPGAPRPREGPLLQCQLVPGTALPMPLASRRSTSPRRPRIARAGRRGDQCSSSLASSARKVRRRAQPAARHSSAGARRPPACSLRATSPCAASHARSWVMSAPSATELGDPFRAYADAMPSNCVFLDTYDLRSGVRRASPSGRSPRPATRPRRRPPRLGDLAYLSIGRARSSTTAWFSRRPHQQRPRRAPHHVAETQGALIGVWGASGQKLATATDQPALGSVYKKLGAVPRDPGGAALPRQLSEQTGESPPGVQRVPGASSCDGLFVAKR